MEAPAPAPQTAEDTAAVTPVLSVRKRDGRSEPFDARRIERAVALCYLDLGRLPRARIQDTVAGVVAALRARHREQGALSVEAVQDAVVAALRATGDDAAAAHYAGYRARHAALRAVRPIPPEVRAAFDASAAYFPTPLQQFQFFDKYSRFDAGKGRRETWEETVDRAVAYLMELVARHSGGSTVLGEGEWGELRAAILRMEVMPSMRLLAMAGPAARRQNVSIYNCLAGNEQLVTRDGVRAFYELEGKTVDVLAGDGQWRPAEVRAFGLQSVNEITLQHWNGGKAGNFRRRVRATANHRWVLLDGAVTTDLKVGDRLAAPDLVTDQERDPEAVRHGFVYGDGTINHQPNGDYVQVRLCGDKAKLLDDVFLGFNFSRPPSYNGDPMVYCGKRPEWKKLPPYNADAHYVAGFIHGLGLADGSRTTAGNLRIDTQSEALAMWLMDNAGAAGYKVLSHRIYTEDTNYGKRTAPLHQVLLGTGASAVLRVEAIREDDMTVPVFCAVEPVTHTFTLANGQVTGNCSYQPVEDIRAFSEALLISMAGCGVGYSVERRYVEKLPPVAPRRALPAQNVNTLLVEDTTEGWAEALDRGLRIWLAGGDINFDLSRIRPAGAPLATKGGRASGPEPLRAMLEGVRGVILARAGRRLRPLDAHDLMCLVGNAAVMGGTRRTAMIALFDWDEQEMLHCKDGDLTGLEHRYNANNSAVWPDRGVTRQELEAQFAAMDAAGRGEPGIFNRAAAERLKPARRASAEWGTNPCGEIILRPYEFCNLSVAVARADDDLATLARKVYLATLLGCIQSLATHFPGLRPEWAANCREERLLGVDITGQMDCPLLRDPEVGTVNVYGRAFGRHVVGPDLAALLDDAEPPVVSPLTLLQKIAVNTAAFTAGRLGIPVPAAVTCVKPSGNSSQLLDCASGLHPRHSRHYVRHVRVGAHTPIARVLREAGAPLLPETGHDPDDPQTLVAAFPVAAPAAALVRAQVSALDQCRHWLYNKLDYTEHNPSVTVSYRPGELPAVVDWVWEHRDQIGGMAFLPAFDAQYALMPYEETTEAEHAARAALFPAIDYAKLWYYEQTDETEAAQTLACLAGTCDL